VPRVTSHTTRLTPREFYSGSRFVRSHTVGRGGETLFEDSAWPPAGRDRCAGDRGDAAVLGWTLPCVGVRVPSDANPHQGMRPTVVLRRCGALCVALLCAAAGGSAPTYTLIVGPPVQLGGLQGVPPAQRTRSVSLSRVFSCPYQPLATSARS
jgi:hypothetical protein